MEPLSALLLAFVQETTTPTVEVREPRLRVHVELDADQSPRELLGLGLDVVTLTDDGRTVRVVADREDLVLLDARDFEYEVVIEDLERWYADRLAQDAQATQEMPALGAWLSPPFGQGSMGGYYTFSEIVSVLNQIQAAYPAIVSVPQSIGRSIEGRDLWAYSVSDSPGTSQGDPEVRMDSLHHSREPMSFHATLWYVLWLVENYGSDPLATYLVDEREQWFVPVVNPDGYVWNETTNPGGGGLWRKNRRLNGDGTRGVDLNRNYPYQWGYDNIGSSPSGSSETYRGTGPASEPETVAMVAFFASHDFETALSSHCYSNLWLRPYGYDFVLSSQEAELAEVGALATAENHYANVPGTDLYPANGTTIDYDHDQHGTFSYLPEIGRDEDGFWPVQSRIVPLAEENLEAYLRTGLAAGVFFHTTDVQLTDAGDGDGSFEAGEDVEITVTVRNSGVAGTGTSVVGALSTTSPNATAGAATHDFGAIASFSQADNAGSPLVLQLAPTAGTGERIPYRLELTADGVTFSIDLVLVAGERFPFASDDLELDLGWTVGDASDTATTGIWERADPTGTTFDGEDLNPDDDASPGAGTQAFVTGNGRGSSGNDDVDGGSTTLYSPPFDLSAVAAAYLEYQRWWSNLSFADDEFAIEVSDDGGASWTTLEYLLATENTWTPVSIRLDDYVALTADMQLRFVATDDGTGSLVEAGIDELSLTVYESGPRITVYGTATTGTSVAINITGRNGDAYALLWSPGTGDLPLPGITGNFLLDPLQFFVPFQGSIPASGLRERILPLPADPTLIGATVYWQALVAGPAGSTLTNRVTMTFD